MRVYRSMIQLERGCGMWSDENRGDIIYARILVATANQPMTYNVEHDG